jgi:hypothetical protein
MLENKEGGETMGVLRRSVSFDLEINVEQRENYFAAMTNPFAITAYGDSEDEAEKRALQAVGILLKVRSKDLSTYLNKLGVKHLTEDTTLPEPTSFNRPRNIVRECRREMRVEVPV